MYVGVPQLVCMCVRACVSPTGRVLACCCARAYVPESLAVCVWICYWLRDVGGGPSCLMIASGGVLSDGACLIGVCVCTRVCLWLTQLGATTCLPVVLGLVLLIVSVRRVCGPPHRGACSPAPSRSTPSCPPAAPGLLARLAPGAASPCLRLQTPSPGNFPSRGLPFSPEAAACAAGLGWGWRWCVEVLQAGLKRPH